MQLKIRQNYKSIPAGLEFELPLFTVLTGENGSGKTHLFEALSDSNNGQIISDGKQFKSISYMAYGALNPKIDEKCDLIQISQSVKRVWNDIQQAQIDLHNKLRNRPHNTPAAASPEQDPILSFIRMPQHRDTLISVSKQSGVMPSQITEDIITDHISMMDLSGTSLFNSKFALIFKSYHLNHINNLLNKVYEEEGIPHTGTFLNNKKFKLKYGEPPWEFVNSVLEKLCLPYKVNNPIGTKRESTFNFKLIHRKSNNEIKTNDLSTGEKTLMSLALAVYNSAGTGDRTEIIILDEPDASLHPSMSKLMLEIIEEEIVNKQGIPVILSTHSISTIACAPANSLYKISSDQKSPEQCNLQDSTRILTHGIPNFRVSIERRRPVFVEHSYDVDYYESLFNIISRKVQFPTTPQFLPPHTLSGSNCEAVLEITRKLRNMGNTQVYGLIDWDLSNIPEQQIIILGMGRRYSIENYIFEPHILGLYLIYKTFVKPKDLGLDDCNSYTEVRSMINNSTKILQTIVDSVESMISWETKDNSASKSQLLDGYIISIRSEILTIQGHKYESLCREAWPKLNSVKGNNDGDSALKKDIINTVINDFPGLISVDLVETLNELK
ncbi:MAG: AAA family ATPase [Candidatus Thiodiazotropha endolucinida]